MIIKDVITPYDKQRVVGFLAEQGLKFEQNSDKTIYIEDADKIVGTVSAARYTINKSGRPFTKPTISVRLR